MRVPYFLGDLKRDPNFENCPYDIQNHRKDPTNRSHNLGPCTNHSVIYRNLETRLKDPFLGFSRWSGYTSHSYAVHEVAVPPVFIGRTSLRPEHILDRDMDGVQRLMPGPWDLIARFKK